MNKWFTGIAGVLVTVVAINLGLPAPIAVELGNEASEQLEQM